MADVVYDQGSGVPPEHAHRMKDMGDGTYAELGLDVAGFPPLLSLPAGTSATGPGVALDNVGVRNNHNLVVTTSAGVATGVVNLEGSQDGIGWVKLLGGSGQSLVVTTNAANTTFYGTANLTPFRFVRANITTVIGGGTITAWVASAG